MVDILSFSTAVDVALGRGATVLPYKWHDGGEEAYGVEHQAVVARPIQHVDSGELTSSLSRLAQLSAGTRLVLPSPHGSALVFGARDAGASRVQVGCIRNAAAIAAANRDRGVVAVIAAGERWHGDTGPVRPAVEDLLGAGSIINALGIEGASPEARAAAAAWVDAAPDIEARLFSCGSGRELTDRDLGADLVFAAQGDVSSVVPTLVGVELRDVENVG